jgi:hypothetical protein
MLLFLLLVLTPRLLVNLFLLLSAEVQLKKTRHDSLNNPEVQSSEDSEINANYVSVKHKNSLPEFLSNNNNNNANHSGSDYSFESCDSYENITVSSGSNTNYQSDEKSKTNPAKDP